MINLYFKLFFNDVFNVNMIKMKKNLILWRHAHAEIGNNDFNRHIDERGKKESKIMAEFILSNSSPDLILSSPATRAQETLFAFNSLYKAPKANIDKNLYHAEPDEILKSIERNSSDENIILVMGHNPGIHELSLSLTNNNQELMVKFSTCSVCFISFDNDNWFNIYNNKCFLDKFIQPKDLNRDKL
tara:strand:+ start:41 stop:601 length:561 start_codon:yes stop_codon:yes gene_type:complete